MYTSLETGESVNRAVIFYVDVVSGMVRTMPGSFPARLDSELFTTTGAGAGDENMSMIIMARPPPQIRPRGCFKLWARNAVSGAAVELSMELEPELGRMLEL